MRGTVKWFDSQKGYGFITNSEGKDIFFHHSNIQMNGFRCLDSDDIVDYEIGTGKNGKEQAVNITPVLTMKMIEDSLKKDHLYVKKVKADKNTIAMNTLRIKTAYIVVDENNMIQSSENGMSFLDLAAYAGFDVVEESA